MEYGEEWRGTKMEDEEDANVSVSRKPLEFTQFRSKLKMQMYLENTNVFGNKIGASIMMSHLITK